MQFEIGSRVAVIDDTITGQVVGFAKGLVVVRDIEGLEYEFLSSELIMLDTKQATLNKYLNSNNILPLEKAIDKKKKNLASVKSTDKKLLEVDLHIEKLLKSHKGMSNHSILTYQIDYAREKLELCLSKKIPKIIFIHGIGKGVLKAELNFLLSEYSVNHYDASYKKYGLGATEVDFY
ncbi:MAG: DNA mismatch repair protein MutS [Tenacibaculum sp.]